jgi:Zn-dependent protease/predicted transcriptional regulator
MSLNVGKLFGIEVRLHYSWFIIFALIAWSLSSNYLPLEYPNQTNNFYYVVGITSAALLFISVLFHEVSHSIEARRNNILVNSITLYFLGGVSETAEEPKTANAELKMVAAGPLTSIALSIIFYFGWRINLGQPLWITATLQYSSYINILLAVFNLVPAFPMDGGRIFRAIIWRRNKDILSATRLATRISNVFGYLFVGLGILDMLFLSGMDGLWFIIIGFFVSTSAQESLNETMVSQALAGVKVEEIMTRDVHTVESDLTLQELVNYAFTKYKHHGFPVMSQGQLVGIVTDEDLRKHQPETWDSLRVKDIMVPAKNLLTINPNMMAVEALIKMSKAGVGRLPVVEQGKLIGIITRSDLTKIVQTRLQYRR